LLTIKGLVEFNYLFLPKLQIQVHFQGWLNQVNADAAAFLS